MGTLFTRALVFSSGAVSAVAFSYTFLWPLGIISFAFLIYVLKNETSPKKGALLGALYGLPFMAGSILWWFGSFPLTSSGINDPVASALLLTTAWIMVSVTLSISSMLFGALFVLFKKNNWSDVLLITSLWVLSEVLRTIFFFILTMAPESLPGLHWTFGFSGYILSGSPLLLQLASLGGVYLLGFIFALLASVFVYSKYSLAKRLIVAFIFVTVLYIPFPDINFSNEPSLRTIITKTTENSYFSSKSIDREAQLKRITELIKKATATISNIDLIVLPEDSRFLELQSDAQISALPIENTTYIIDSSRVQLPNGSATSKIMTYARGEGVTRQYTKRLLVPEGEYLSYTYKTLLVTFGLKEKIREFISTKAYSRGDLDTATLVNNSLPVAASLCSEIYSPHLQRNLSQDSGIIVNMGSHSRLKGSNILFNQIVAMSKVRAVENGKYLVRATNFDESFVISPSGRIVAMTNPKKPFDFITYSVPILYNQTLFSRAPYAAPVIALIIVSFLIFRRRFLQKHN